MVKVEKDYTNKKVRIKCGILTGVFGLITNLVLFLIKFMIGFTANSMTIIADAFNSLSDLGSCFVTILGFKMASKPADKEHPYGHSRYEYIAGMTISIFMLLTGAFLSKASLDKIYVPEGMILTSTTFVVLVISIIIKFFQMLVYWKIAKKMNSPVIKASARDARNDILITSASLLSLLFMKIIRLNLDAYTGLAVSMLVIYTSIRSTRESVDPLLGSPADIELVNKIKEIFLSHEEILGIHDLIVHTYGSDATFATVDAEVDALMTLVEAHDLANKIEKEVENQLGVKLTIHIDPIQLENEKVEDIYRRTKIALKEIDNDLKFHDFEVFTENHKVYVGFEALVPFGKKYTGEQLEELMRNAYKKDENDEYEYDFEIQVDRPFY
jgi:cation diffusion facilitator family transporter